MKRLKNIRWFALLPFLIVACSTGKSNTLDTGQNVVDEIVVTAYVTTATRSSEFMKQEIAFAHQADNRSPFTITLLRDKEYQTMDGFGAAITGSTAYNLLQMSKENRWNFL